MITDRDRKILSHIEIYKYATIEQIRKIFFSKQKNGYNIARRRMNELKKAGYLIVTRDLQTNRNVYMLNERSVKPPSAHRLLLLDVLSNLYYYGFDVKVFFIEKAWMDGRIRSDAFTIFTLETDKVKNRYHYFIEIHLSNNPPNLDKYDRLYETNEVQTWLGRAVFPRVMLVTDAEYYQPLKYTNVVTLPTSLDGFASVILP